MNKNKTEVILNLVKEVNSGNHYKYLRPLCDYTLDEIYEVINGFPSMAGNFYEIPLLLHYFFRLHTHAGVLVNIDRGGRKEPAKLTSLSKITGGTNAGGSVDITHIDFDGGGIIGITSKYKKKSTLGLAELEFLAVKATIDQTFPNTQNKYYGISIRDRKQVEHLFKSNELPKDTVVYDFSNMRKFWDDIRKYLKEDTRSLYDIENHINKHHKIHITLRKEQEDGVNAAIEYFKKYGDDFLLHAKMRYGKICTAYEIAKRMKAKTVLMATFFPAVSKQWEEDAFNFDNYHNLRIVNAADFRGKYIDIRTKFKDEIVVVLTSYQDFKESANKIKWSKVNNHNWDLLISDEFHYGVESQQTTELLSTVKFKKHLALSGTPLKALLRGTFNTKNTFTWSYIDEQRAKATGLPEYEWLPKMNIHMIDVPQSIQNDLVCYDDDESFTINKLFSTNKDNEFLYEDSVIRFIDMISGEKGFKKNLSPYYYGSTHCNGLRHTVWYMPDVNSTIAIEKLLKEHSFFKRYNIISINSNKYKAKDVLHIVRHHTEQADTKDSAGSITLAYKQLNTGSSIPKWTGVFMLNNTQSIETYMQTIFRAQSQNKRDFKRECHVFDFNPDRCLSIMYEYASINEDAKNPIEAIKEWLEFAPLLSHNENSIITINTNEFVERLAITGSYSKAFGHELSINVDALTDDIICKIDKLWNSKTSVDISDLPNNRMIHGKNFTTEISDTTTKEAKDKKHKTILRSIAQSIPWLLLFTNNKYNNVLDAIDNITSINEKAYIERSGVTSDILKLLLKSNILNLSHINKQTISFNHIVANNKETILDNMIMDSSCDYNIRQYGEVHTDMITIHRMLDMLPSSIWTDPSLRWLDPTCGSGSFLMAIFTRLMIGLVDRIPDENKRAKHILTNMMYGIDIRLSNVLLSKLRLKYGRSQIKNIQCADTLQYDFWNMEFDVIVGHTPFITSNNELFVDVCVKKLKANGHLIQLAALPEPNSIVHNHFAEQTLHHVETNTYMLYHLQKCNHRKNHQLSYKSTFDNMTYTGKVNYSTINRIIAILNDDAISIFNKVINYKAPKFELIDGWRMRFADEKSIVSTHEYADSSCDGWKNRKWAATEYEYQYKNKVILSKLNIPNPMYDNGKLGLTHNSFGILVKNAQIGNNVIHLLNSKLYMFIISLLDINFRRYQDINHYQLLPMIDLSGKLDNDTIYKAFNLTKKEITFLETVV